MNIGESLKNILIELPREVKLVVVTKTQAVDVIREIYEEGHKIFGENKAQELILKQPELPQDIEWHFIGHLQTNKVKFIAPFVSLIHSVDSYKLLKEINKQALRNNRTIDCLIQLFIAEEETKFGLDINEAMHLLEEYKSSSLDNVHIKGVMGMATFTGDMEQVRSEFRKLKRHFISLRETYFKDDPAFRELSMGMSGDYKTAIEEGSTIVRIGSAIFA